MMHIRYANESDLIELAALYRQTVLTHAPNRYNPDQTKIWASFASDIEHFTQFILGVTTFVVTDQTAILGFAGIGEDGHVTSVYVRHDCIRQGIGSCLMQTILTYAESRSIPRLYAEASEFSLGLFIKFGFHLYDTEIVDRNGVQFKRYLVERLL